MMESPFNDGPSDRERALEAGIRKALEACAEIETMKLAERTGAWVAEILESLLPEFQLRSFPELVHDLHKLPEPTVPNGWKPETKEVGN